VSTARIGEVELGRGRPKVCVPFVGATVAELAAEAAAVRADVADLVELRLDRFAAFRAPDGATSALDAVRTALDPALPVLVTVRTAREGGGADLPPEEHLALVTRIAGHPATDAVDVEMGLPGDLTARAVAAVHDRGLPVVMSFHDLAGTPRRDAIVARLARQQEQGADVVKRACTPRTPEDVLTLLGATVEYTARADARPAITMAMGRLGVVSRIAGETFGSCLTFGTVGAASAPGQVDAARLGATLDLLHGASVHGG